MNNNHQKVLDLAKGLLQYLKQHPEALQKFAKLPVQELEKACGTKTKFERCMAQVSKQPGVTNPAAICVAAGVKPEKWKKEELSGAPQDKKFIKELVLEELKKPFIPRFYRREEKTKKQQMDVASKQIASLKRIKPYIGKTPNSVGMKIR